MTDEKLDLLLRDALKPGETPPALDLTAKKKPVRSKLPGILAACACLAVCAAAYFAVQPFFGAGSAAPESASVTMDTAEGAVEKFSASVQETEAAATMTQSADRETVVPAQPAMGEDLCGYPPAENGSVMAAADEWMQRNAPGAAYEVIAESEGYCSMRADLAEDEALYLVIDKQTMEPVPLEQLLERGNFAVDIQQVDMLYVNQDQELILVQGDGEVNLGPIE